MNLFESVRAGVSARDAAQRYGIRVQKNGMACCPFHNDRHPSMKLDRRFHCFGCQADGDAINFVERLYGLGPVDAAKKLATDFGIAWEDGRRKKETGRTAVKRENSSSGREAKLERQMKRWVNHAEEVLLRYRVLLHAWEQYYRPWTVEEEWHPLFCEALDKKERIDDLLDELMLGDDKDRLGFFHNHRKEVSGIEKRIAEYERGIPDGIGK